MGSSAHTKAIQNSADPLQRQTNKLAAAMKPGEHGRIAISMGHGRDAEGVLHTVVRSSEPTRVDGTARLRRGPQTILDNDPEFANVKLGVTPSVEGGPSSPTSGK